MVAHPSARLTQRQQSVGCPGRLTKTCHALWSAGSRPPVLAALPARRPAPAHWTTRWRHRSQGLLLPDVGRADPERRSRELVSAQTRRDGGRVPRGAGRADGQGPRPAAGAAEGAARAVLRPRGKFPPAPPCTACYPLVCGRSAPVWCDRCGGTGGLRGQLFARRALWLAAQLQRPREPSPAWLCGRRSASTSSAGCARTSWWVGGGWQRALAPFLAPALAVAVQASGTRMFRASQALPFCPVSVAQ